MNIDRSIVISAVIVCVCVCVCVWVGKGGWLARDVE